MRRISMWRGIGIAATCTIAALVAAEAACAVIPHREIHLASAVGLILYLLLLARSIKPPRRMVGTAGLVVLTALMAFVGGTFVSLAFLGVLFLGRSLLLAEDLSDVGLEIILSCTALILGLWAASHGAAAMVWCLGVLLAGAPLLRPGREACTAPSQSFDASCSVAERALERLVRQRG